MVDELTWYSRYSRLVDISSGAESLFKLILDIGYDKILMNIYNYDL